jgi:hypothetical protein
MNLEDIISVEAITEIDKDNFIYNEVQILKSDIKSIEIPDGIFGNTFIVLNDGSRIETEEDILFVYAKLGTVFTIDLA